MFHGRIQAAHCAEFRRQLAREKTLWKRQPSHLAQPVNVFVPARTLRSSLSTLLADRYFGLKIDRRSFRYLTTIRHGTTCSDDIRTIRTFRGSFRKHLTHTHIFVRLLNASLLAPAKVALSNSSSVCPKSPDALDCRHIMGINFIRTIWGQLKIN